MPLRCGNDRQLAGQVLALGFYVAPLCLATNFHWTPFAADDSGETLPRLWRTAPLSSCSSSSPTLANQARTGLGCSAPLFNGQSCRESDSIQGLTAPCVLTKKPKVQNMFSSSPLSFGRGSGSVLLLRANADVETHKIQFCGPLPAARGALEDMTCLLLSGRLRRRRLQLQRPFSVPRRDKFAPRNGSVRCRTRAEMSWRNTLQLPAVSAPAFSRRRWQAFLQMSRPVREGARGSRSRPTVFR